MNERTDPPTHMPQASAETTRASASGPASGPAAMSAGRFIRRSLSYHWRIHLTVGLGVAAATAVLCGALLVGDSVRGSLRQLTVERLGRIDYVLASDRFFHEELADEIAARDGFHDHFHDATAAILIAHATIERRPTSETENATPEPADDANDGNEGSGSVGQVADGRRTQRASEVTVIGAEDSFWELDAVGVRPAVFPAKDEVVLNEPLASELGARVGDEVTLRLPSGDQVPADSPLADTRERVLGLPRLKVVAIVPARGLGRFDLRPSQSVPRNVYASRETIQEALDLTGRANGLFIGGQSESPAPGEQAEAAARMLADAVLPAWDESGGNQLSGLTFEDYGLQIKRVTQEFAPKSGAAETIFDYFSLTTDRMLFSPAMGTSIGQAVAADHGVPVLTYLANTIAKVEAETPNETGANRDDANGTDVSDSPARAASVHPGIPYSLVTAIDSSPAFDLIGEVQAGVGDTTAEEQPDKQSADDEPLAADEIVLNHWTAGDLKAKVGDPIRLTYFEPETAHGRSVERSADFRLRAIVPLTEPLEPPDRRGVARFDERPTLANDPDLTPEVEGFTDQRTIRDADPPFPFDRDRIRGEDDDYWEKYLTTPKAFVSLESGQAMWGSRFGEITSYRIPFAEGIDEASLRRKVVEQLSRDNRAIGFEFRAVKQRQLAASAGTTPFDGLFFGLSLFVIVAALMLVSLLFRLGLERRASELGTLVALGIHRRRAARWLIAEGVIVASAGALVGVGAGMGYAWLMLAGLRSWWVDAITTPFLEFHFTSRSLILGWALGVAACAGAIAWSARQARRVSPRSLLAGRMETSRFGASRSGRWIGFAAIVALVGAIGLAAAAMKLGGEAQAGAFVGSGALMLVAALIFVSLRLKRESAGGRAAAGLARLAASSARRNPGRSTLSIGLIAAASFLIVAMSAFQLDPSPAGAGGFNLYAISSQPIFADLNDPAARRERLSVDAPELQGATILSLRVKPGDDASCTNLYRPTQPRVLGVTQQMIDYFDQVPDGFDWAASAAATDAERNNPWRLLHTSGETAADDDDGTINDDERTTNRDDGPTDGEDKTADSGDGSTGRDDPADGDAIPVVLDKNTAMYSLQMYGGVGEVKSFTYDSGATLKVRVVGLLSNSIFQGSLLVAEQDLSRTFPEVSGYGFFLVKTSPERESGAAAALEDRLGDEGFDARLARDLLVQLLAVQNTYLKTFQALGALGLLLGTFGLATVQLRSVLERRGELALLRAAGFRRSRLASLVMLENVLLLLGGLAAGVMAALVAVLPHMIFGEASVPFGTLAAMLGIVTVAGVLSSLLGVAAVLRAPLVAALRGD